MRCGLRGQTWRGVGWAGNAKKVEFRLSRGSVIISSGFLDEAIGMDVFLKFILYMSICIYLFKDAAGFLDEAISRCLEVPVRS